MYGGSMHGLVHIRVAEAGVQGWKTQGMGNGFAETGEMGWVGITKGIEEFGLYSASSVGCSYISKGIPPYMNSFMEFQAAKKHTSGTDLAEAGEAAEHYLLETPPLPHHGAARNIDTESWGSMEYSL